MNKATIKKLTEIYKLGHLPCRGNEPYCETFRLANCFEHACINLTNEQIKQFEISESESAEFGNFYALTQKGTSMQFKKTLEQAGLQVEECDPDKVLKDSQWKVALYFEYFYMINKDFHFLIQEKDGRWSGKNGYTSNCQIFNTLPKRIEFGNRLYNFYSTFCITNPFASKENITWIDK